MPLEDHIGDICRKARLQTNTEMSDCAAIAGLSQDELSAWETDGVSGREINVEALAELVGLSPVKALAIAGGWKPGGVDMSRWRELRMITTKEGFEVNSFVVWDSVTRQAALFDTGWFADEIFRLADKEKLNVEHLFITHMHGDHVAALGDVRGRWPEIQLHTNNSGAPERNRVTHGQTVSVGGLKVAVRLTPGHADDGVTYVLEGWANTAPPVAVVGDAIFAGSMGKDFSTPELAQSKVREEILSLPADTLICPGHGPLTTVGEETANNPFF